MTIRGLGSGHLFDPTVTADGTHAWAVFAVPAKLAPDTEDATAEKEDQARALVKVSLRDGAITVVDDRISDKLIAHLAADASREHLLVYGNTGPAPSVPGNDARKAVGRYEDGEVTWLDAAEAPEQVAW